MRTPRSKIRIIVKPWIPRNVPYQIPITTVKEVLQHAYPQLQKVVYVGWARRMIDGKKQIVYLAATGDSGSDARKAFKTSESFGKNIWLLQA